MAIHEHGRKPVTIHDVGEDGYCEICRPDAAPPPSDAAPGALAVALADGFRNLGAGDGGVTHPATWSLGAWVLYAIEVIKLYAHPEDAPGDDTQLAVTHLLALKDNWDSYGGRIISKKAVDAAVRLRNVLATMPSFVPMSDGGVQVEWHSRGFDVELEIEPNGRLVEDAPESPVPPGGPWQAYRRWVTDEDGASYETCWWSVCSKEDEDLSYNLRCLTEEQAIAVRDQLNREVRDKGEKT